MKRKLMARAGVKLILGLAAFGLLLFLPAGTWSFWNAWLLLGILFLPMLGMGAYLLYKAPELLAKRLNVKEREREQRLVVALSLVMFTAGFGVAALDYRFGFSRLPAWASLAAALLFLVGYGLYFEVMRENAYLSRTVEVQDNQRVIDTGLYGVVRHPMYLATILIFLAVPLVLGSLSACLPFLIYPFLLVKRIKNEEAVLKDGLDGYTAYTTKVRYRLIPFVW